MSNTVAPTVKAGDDQKQNTPDPFFNGMDDVLKSYSFNYEALAAYKKEVAFSNEVVGGFMCFPLPYICYESCTKANIHDEVYARHIALTPDGIRYIVDKHKAECRCDCQEVGRTSQTVPYDKITDCDVEEPAGAEGSCLMLVPRTMYTFNVSTANGEAVSLWGIDAPYELKKDVWSMKRGQGIAGVEMSSIAPSAVSMVRAEGGGMLPASAHAGGGGGSASTDYLLGEILKTLKEQNEILRSKA